MEATINGGQNITCRVEDGKLTISDDKPAWCKVPTINDARVPPGLGVFCRGASPIVITLTQREVEKVASVEAHYLGVLRRDERGNYFAVRAGASEPDGHDIVDFTSTTWPSAPVLYFRDEDEARTAIALLEQGIKPFFLEKPEDDDLGDADLGDGELGEGDDLGD